MSWFNTRWRRNTESAAATSQTLAPVLGTSLGKARLNDLVSWNITFNNRDGLPRVYNRALSTLPDETLAVFIHDDVFIYDYFLAHRVNDAARIFDVFGLAGHPAPRGDHVSWMHWRVFGTNGMPIDDSCVTSGAIENSPPGGNLSIGYFGPSPRNVKLLDGVFLGGRTSTLRRCAIKFDEQFDFHFYDLDFCRTCAAAGLSIGTWPIAVSHASAGAFGSQAWEVALAKYQSKWRDKAL